MNDPTFTPAESFSDQLPDPTVPGPPVDPVDRHRRYQAFAMFGCKNLWKEEYAVMPRLEVAYALADRIKEHPAIPKVIDCLKNQDNIATQLNELPAVAALKDAVTFFVERKAKITQEAEARDKLRHQIKRHQGEISRHEMAMSAYARSAVEAGVIKPYHAYQAGEYVLVVLQQKESGDYYVTMMPLEKPQPGE